jgi:N-acetylglucosamine kinase-like BadF-type ATPase
MVAGLDAGGTKLAVCVETMSGEPVQAAEFPAAGWEASPAREAAAWLDHRLRLVLPPGAVVASIGVGAQGCNTAAACTDLEQALAKRGLPATVVNDGALLVPAAGLATGIGVIAGTGSVAIGTDESGRLLRTGGWGWVLGDDGGAAAIVREATKAALATHDSGLPDDGLLAALQAAFGVRSAEELTRTVNDRPTAEHWAPRAPAVFTAAEAGSAQAAGVIAAGAEALADLVTRLISRGAVGTTVVAAGSVITRQPWLAQAFARCLSKRHPALEFRLLAQPPVTGAVVLARRQLSRHRDQ